MYRTNALRPLLITRRIVQHQQPYLLLIHIHELAGPLYVVFRLGTRAAGRGKLPSSIIEYLR
ncbi:hypothetical protein AO073_22010 [Pseudomonas syringae ICMP 11293]|uniref:hypothetical protein n=1 Tax=Pseudomonas syringae TaxID=317 RepID=UPI0007310D0E|nr:hypothetical protein [Pseudomonas syringae]KTB90690.1 hypothetical protein AO073_22010 [Pseudomonas syringae ICMP 11293]